MWVREELPCFGMGGGGGAVVAWHGCESLWGIATCERKRCMKFERVYHKGPCDGVITSNEARIVAVVISCSMACMSLYTNLRPKVNRTHGV